MENTLIQEQINTLPNTAKQLRAMYQATEYYWRLWLEPIQHIVPKNTRLYTPKQILAIVKELGLPKQIKK